jgi:hypothetical protein
MAYMNQSEKARLAPKIKAVLKKYNMKGSLAVRNYSTLVLNLKQGPLDLVKGRDVESGYSQINQYWLADSYQGKELKFLREVVDAMNDGNHDTSNAQIDYFCVGWYVNVNAGHWNKPYIKAA